MDSRYNRGSTLSFMSMTSRWTVCRNDAFSPDRDAVLSDKRQARPGMKGWPDRDALKKNVTGNSGCRRILRQAVFLSEQGGRQARRKSTAACLLKYNDARIGRNGADFLTGRRKTKLARAVFPDKREKKLKRARVTRYVDMSVTGTYAGRITCFYKETVCLNLWSRFVVPSKSCCTTS